MDNPLAYDKPAIDESREQIFVRTVRHELLTPLSALVGMLHLVDAKGVLDSSAQECLNYARDSAQSLVTKTLAILEYAALVKTQQTPSLSKQRLVPILQNLAASWQAHAEAKGVKLITHIKPQFPDVAYVDAQRLRHLLEILLSNAIKFTNSGTITVGIDTGPELWVRDTGIGISAEQQESIFLPFLQLDDSLARQHGGMGLGLAIARHLAHVMGATLSVTSSPGTGSVFTVKLNSTATR